MILVLFLFVTFQTQAALLSSSGAISTTENGIFEFSVNQSSSTVNLWEQSSNDFRITLFDGNDLFVTSNDDNSFGTNNGPLHAGQDFLDASLLLSLFEGNYTVAVSHWLNISTTSIDAFSTNRSTGIYSMFVEGDGISAGHVAASSAVPAPAAIWLMLSAIPGIIHLSRRRNSISATA